MVFSEDSLAPVAYMRPRRFHVEPKADTNKGHGEVFEVPDGWKEDECCTRDACCEVLAQNTCEDEKVCLGL